MTKKAVIIRILSRDESNALLVRNHIGRLASSLHDRVDIEPIHYVYADGVLYGRTSPGSKLTTLKHRPWVAFEVDEVEDLFEWRSVVVHGAVYPVEDGDGSTEHATYARGVAASARARAGGAPRRRSNAVSFGALSPPRGLGDGA
jgi:nitroimidazol reductase NimA-like FMN-containing flavoprotein (pyridoxamine 5'-phosphate oxidase superfamily)